jgi:F-type H+-transporting ATPase subunit epsilon
MPLQVEIVTPEHTVYQEDNVRLVGAPGVMGQLGILPSHAAFVTMLEPGELRVVKESGEETVMAITHGFLEVRDDRVVLLTDTAERAEEIDVARAEEARRRAQERLATRVADIDLARAEAALRRAVIRLKVVEITRRRRGQRPTGGPPTLE